MCFPPGPCSENVDAVNRKLSQRGCWQQAPCGIQQTTMGLGRWAGKSPGSKYPKCFPRQNTHPLRDLPRRAAPRPRAEQAGHAIRRDPCLCLGLFSPGRPRYSASRSVSRSVGLSVGPSGVCLSVCLSARPSPRAACLAPKCLAWPTSDSIVSDFSQSEAMRGRGGARGADVTARDWSAPPLRPLSGPPPTLPRPSATLPEGPDRMAATAAHGLMKARRVGL